MYTFRTQRNSGFTLVETLVAVTILLTVVIGPMTIASRGMKNAYFAGDQTTAIYLAQEAIEYVQKLRDDEALEHFDEYTTDPNQPRDGNTWNWYGDIISGTSCDESDGCDIDFTGTPSFDRDCGITEQCLLRRFTGDPSTVDRVYGYESGSDWEVSPYTRKVFIGPYIDGGVPVRVDVTWGTTLFGGISRTVTLQTYVYEHYKRYE